MRIRDICGNLEEPIIFKAKPCSLEFPGFFGLLNDREVGDAFENHYLVVETLYPYESAGCSKNGKCKYVDAVGRLVVIDPDMTRCGDYTGEAKAFPLTKALPCLPFAHP